MLSGFKIYQKSGPSKRPGLLIFVGPYGDGGGYYEREVAKMYARKGMAVFLADYYPGTHGDTNPMTMFPALAEYSTNPAFGGQSYLGQTARAQATALQNLQQVQAWSIVDTKKIGVFGFCFGGAMALQMARAGGEAAVVVSFHGEYPPAAKQPMQTEVLTKLGLWQPNLPTCFDVKQEFQKQGCCGMPTKMFSKGGKEVMGNKSAGRRLSQDTLLDDVKLLLEEAKMQGGASHARKMAADLIGFVEKAAKDAA
jgi:dienelactone hydrolase